jgi:hypothetical protein
MKFCLLLFLYFALNVSLLLATIEALFSELAEDNEVMRERTLKMLAMKLRTLETGVMKPEVKELLIKECKKILQASFC